MMKWEILEPGIEDMMHEIFTHQESNMKTLASTKLYEGARISVLATILLLLNLKAIFGWSDTSFTALLRFLADKLLPEGNRLPRSYREVKNSLSDLGMDYKVYHACPNDCMLFYQENENKENCHVCGESRYEHQGVVKSIKVPRKVLRHFPLIPQLKHVFQCKDIGNLMDWHSYNKSIDGTMRIVADGKAWKEIDEQWPDFASEPRNARISIAMDGFNPYSIQSSMYSIWPIVAVVNNLPPWMAIKKEQIMLTLIVPGKYQVKNMDIYLRPVIDELKVLWKGFQMHDISRPIGRRDFFFRGMMCWTIHDAPGLSVCCGIQTKGKFGCPSCGSETIAKHSNHLKKVIFHEYRQFLPINHRYRVRKRGEFNNKAMKLPIPKCMTPNDWYTAYNNVEGELPRGMKRFSIFYELPYYRYLPIAHLLDVMHIGCNVSKSLWYLINGKKVDGLRLRRDLQENNVMPHLWPNPIDDSYSIGPWRLTNEEKRQVKSTIKEIKFPTGFAATLKNAFTRGKDEELTGLKTHDWHNLLKVILPVIIPNSFDKDIRDAIFDLSGYMRWLTSKEIRMEDIDYWKKQAPILLCKIQKHLPLTFFDSQVHYLVHLVREIEYCGPVTSRSMWLVERLLKVLKHFVRQRARPEGSIATGYTTFKAMVRVTQYLPKFHLDTPIFWSKCQQDMLTGEVLQIRSKLRTIRDPYEWERMHVFVSHHTKCMEKWIDSYNTKKEEADRNAYLNLSRRVGSMNTNHKRKLPLEHRNTWPNKCTWSWLRENIIFQNNKDPTIVSKEELEIATGTHMRKVRHYKAMWAYGKHFRIEKTDELRNSFDR
ncbi:hypothetical protein KI387_014436, partial [Taxus chinensis]